MASAVSKRQQARNERALQEISKKVPGNDRCADCNAPNPSWASWNLGVFLCMRCAGLHRKLGTHLSKVKSLSMDSWNTEQVENMRKMGNINSNRQLNPRNVSAQIPIDVDEADTAVEKHIRQKYEQRAFMTATNNAPAARQNTGSTGVGSDEPPPLPPKPGKHWYSLRSTSSTLPKSSKYDLPDAPISSAIKVEERGGRPGRAGLFGMRVTSAGNNFDQKLNMLKEMGFADAKQNQDILKSVDCSLDRAVEILSRLNEDLPSTSGSQNPAPISKTPSSGLKLTKTRDSHASAWEVREPKRSATAPLPPLPESSQSNIATSNTWNPFLQPTQQPQQQSITSSMQNLTLTSDPIQANQFATQQPLSVQTKGDPWGLYMQPQQAMSVPAMPLQPFAQASPASSNPFYQSASPQSLTSSNPWSQQMTPQTGTPLTPHSNPFGIPWSGEAPIQKSQNQHIASLNPFPSPQPQANPSNAFFEPSQSYMNPQQTTAYAMQSNAIQAMAQPQQQIPGYSIQVDPQMTLPQMPLQQQPTSYNMQAPAPQSMFVPQQMPPFHQQQQSAPAQGMAPQATGMAPIRHDKSSIMALYNYPQMAPPPMQQLQTLPEDSVSAPVTQLQGNNPFAFQQQQLSNSITTHASKESVDFQSFHQNGRQSPDAFAGLSSRFTR